MFTSLARHHWTLPWECARSGALGFEASSRRVGLYIVSVQSKFSDKSIFFKTSHFSLLQQYWSWLVWGCPCLLGSALLYPKNDDEKHHVFYINGLTSQIQSFTNGPTNPQSRSQQSARLRRARRHAAARKLQSWAKGAKKRWKHFLSKKRLLFDFCGRLLWNKKCCGARLVGWLGW